MTLKRNTLEWFCRFVESLELLLIESRYDWREIRGGLAIEFEDGNDACFIRPVTLSQWVEGNNSDERTAARAALNQFERVNSIRRQVVIGLRHHLAQNQVASMRTAGSCWGLQLGGMATSSVTVGARLTQLCQKLSAMDAFQKLLEHTFLAKVSDAEAAELVSRAVPPQIEPRWRDDSEVEWPSVGASTWATLDCSLIEEVADKIADGDPDAAARSVTRRAHEPWIEVLRGLESRLGVSRVSFDLCAPRGTAELKFSDGYDEMRVVLAGKRMSRQIQELGIAECVRQIVDEFEQLDRARTQVVNGILKFLASRGYCTNTFSFDPGLWFGRTHREVHFDPGHALTNELRRHGATDVVRAWLEKSFASEVVSDEMLAPLMNTPLTKPKERRLPKSAPTGKSKLATLDDAAMTALDRLADELIEKAKRRFRNVGTAGELNLYQVWSDPKWHRRGIDTWTDEDFFIEKARQIWSEHEYDCYAAILMLNGDFAPKQAILERYKKFDFYSEECMDDAMTWLLRDDLPYLITEISDAPKYPFVLGSPPPELARERAITVRQHLSEAIATTDATSNRQHLLSAVESASELDHVSAAEWLTREELEKLHEACCRWAATCDDAIGYMPLLTSAQFLWCDVPPILETNESFMATLFDTEADFQLGDFVLTLSRISASSFTQRVAAYAMTRYESPREFFTASHLAKMGGSPEMFVPLYDELRFAGAIAWQRSREGLVG